MGKWQRRVGFSNELRNASAELNMGRKDPREILAAVRAACDQAEAELRQLDDIGEPEPAAPAVRKKTQSRKAARTRG